jgi:hypothetical protein
MFVVVKSKSQRKALSSHLVCSRCRTAGPSVDGDDYDAARQAAAGWLEHLEPVLTPTGRRKRRGGHVVHELCPKCAAEKLT